MIFTIYILSIRINYKFKKIEIIPIQQQVHGKINSKKIRNAIFLIYVDKKIKILTLRMFSPLVFDLSKL
jgi:hypothetical protein